jgi:hypothetical protein
MGESCAKDAVAIPRIAKASIRLRIDRFIVVSFSIGLLPSLGGIAGSGGATS